MKSRTLSAAFTITAIVVAIAAVLALGSARVSGHSSPDAGQQQDSTQQKRGKNGTASASTPQASPAAPAPGDSSSAQDQADQDSPPAPAPSAKGQGRTGSGAGSGGTASRRYDQSGSTSSSSANSRASSDDPLGSHSGAHPNRSGPEPPPFDRPPLGSRTSEAADSSSSRQPAVPASAQPSAQPRRDRVGYPGGDSSASSSDPGRGRSDKPELRRSPDLGPAPPAGSSDRGRPPVLQRRTDDQSNDDSTPQRQQQPRSQSGQSGGGEETIRLDATLVNLPLLVSDRSGRFIPQLSKKDFDIYEDGVKQEIAFFGNEEVAFNVALLLDLSPSVSNSLEEIQEAAIAFVRQMRPEDRIMIVAFDRSVRFLTDFTNDRSVLQRAIDNTRTGSGTSVYEAVYDTVADRLRHVQGRKALILLSDGEDTTSRSVGYDEAINAVTESDVLVYGLRFPDTGGYRTQNGPWSYPRNRLPFPIPGTRIPFPFPWPHLGPTDPPTDPRSSANGGQWGRRSGRDTGHGRDFMADVAEAGGGPVYDAKTVRDMPRLARQIADELRHVYVVSYYPTNSLSNGGYRSIRVQVKGRDDIAVRHRRGYDAAEVRSRPTI